jgi:hypothetical protein
VCEIYLVRPNALMDNGGAFIEAKSAFLDECKRIFD